ncbi:MAG: hypothetical protein LBN41_11610 [Enterobacteriaceae bacterium]|nr:hypothetical protein [Enterobacteriaceae bacterium]
MNRAEFNQYNINTKVVQRIIANVLDHQHWQVSGDKQCLNAKILSRI